MGDTFAGMTPNRIGWRSRIDILLYGPVAAMPGLWALGIPASRYLSMAARRGSVLVLAMMTPGRSQVTLEVSGSTEPASGVCGMPQLRITRQRRTAGMRQRDREEPLIPADPRDPDIARAKRLQRQSGGPDKRRAQPLLCTPRTGYADV